MIFMNGDDFVLPSKPEYQPCWISYLGAVQGVLKSLEKDYSLDQVGGYSGWSFLVNVSEEHLCPSGPTAHKEYEEILKGTESLGFNIYGINQPELMSKDDEGEIDQEVLFKRFFNRVKQDIRKLNKPAVVWGIPVPEYGIVYGFEGDNYKVSTLRRVLNQQDDPIKYNKLQAPGGLHAFYFADENEGITEEKNKEAIERAIKMAKGEDFTHQNYVAGPEAFEVWADNLEQREFDENSYQGNSYVGACTHEGLYTSAEFLLSISNINTNTSQSVSLEKASKEYKTATALMKQFVEIFPFAFKGELSRENCREGAVRLRNIRPKIVNAIKFMQDALSDW